MAKQAGKDIAISINTTGATYAALGGLKSKGIKLSAGAIDVTDSDSPGRWREILDGVSSAQSADISFDGHFVDDTAIETIRAAYWSSTNKDFKIVIPDYGTIEGSFKITDLNLNGADTGAVMASGTLASAGEITFTAA